MAASFTPPGMVTADTRPSSDQLYATVAELQTDFGLTATEAEIRLAQTLINGFCNRRSLWPEEYEQRLEIPSDRNAVTLSARPVLAILTASGRYGYGRRDRRQLNSTNMDYLAALAMFGSPPRFTPLDVNQMEVESSSGEVWLPTGFFLVQYSQLQVVYLSGFVDIPYRIKGYLAMVINEICTKGSADRTSYSVGRVSRTYATPSFLNQDVRAGLQPFIIRSLM